MTERIVICDHGEIEASLVPESLLGKPGNCPAGVYETILLIKGTPVDWERHVLRLTKGCMDAGIVPEKVFSHNIQQAVHLAALNNLETGLARLRMQVFQHPVTLLSGASTHFLAAVWPVKEIHPTPFRVIIGAHRRAPHDSSYNVKLMGRTYVEEEMYAAAAAGFNDTIFLNTRDELCEGAYSNLWLVTPEGIFTPPLASPCLPGITREKVKQTCAELGLKVEDKLPLPLQTLSDVSLAFLSSSIRGIQIIDKIEGVPGYQPQMQDRNLATLLADRINPT